MFDDFLPIEGFNNTISEIENFEIVRNPNEDGFYRSKFSFAQRRGLFSEKAGDGSYNWQLDAEFKGKYQYDGVVYVWDADCNVYTFTKSGNSYDLVKIYDNPGNESSLYEFDLDGIRVKQRALRIGYISDVVNSWTVDGVLTVNDDGNGNTVLVVNEVGTFSTASVGQYIYMTYAGSETSRFQIRQIIEYVDDKTVYLDSMFYAVPGNNEPGETYSEIGDTIIFNNIRNINGQILTINVNDPTEHHFRSLGGKDIEFFEGRLWYINEFGSSVAGSIATGEYEVMDINTILGSSLDKRGSRMLSFVNVRNFLIIGTSAGLAGVWKIVNATATNDDIFVMNYINSSLYPYGATSLINKSGSIYMIPIIGKLYSVDVIAYSATVVQGVEKEQGLTIKKYLNEISDGDVINMYEDTFGFNIVITKQTETVVLKYYDTYKGWLVHRYNTPIYDTFMQFYDDEVVGVGDKICLLRGHDDLGEKIEQKLVVTGSDNIPLGGFTLQKIILGLGYIGRVADFKIKIEMGEEVFISKIEKDADGVKYLTWQNVAATNGTIGSSLIGVLNYGGSNTLSDKINKIGLIGIPIMKACTNYKITLNNLDGKDLTYCGMRCVLKVGNPFSTPQGNVF